MSGTLRVNLISRLFKISDVGKKDDSVGSLPTPHPTSPQLLLTSSSVHMKLVLLGHSK